jgi:uncharacterized membrane protein YeaQ/YmgE (transglycosylase-associated protein family)
MTVFTDVVITIGSYTWTIGTAVIMYIIIAAVVGLIAEIIVGWRVPFGIIGATIAGAIGVWLMTHVINVQITNLNDPVVWGVPIIHGIIGGIIFVAIWHLLVSAGRGSRRRTRIA